MRRTPIIETKDRGIPVDPLVFLRETARNFGVTNFTYWKNRKYWQDADYYEGEHFFTIQSEPIPATNLGDVLKEGYRDSSRFWNHIGEPAYSYVCAAIGHSWNGKQISYGPKFRMPHEAVEYLIGVPTKPGEEWEPKSDLGRNLWEQASSNKLETTAKINLGDFRLEKDDFGFFGPYKEQMTVYVEWRLGELAIGAVSAFNSEGTVTFIEREGSLFSAQRSFTTPLISSDVLEDIAYDFDYRPYIHRMLEIHVQTPKSKWHDPKSYSNGANLDDYLRFFFNELQAAELSKKARLAQLSLGFWHSVPKLNLGLTTFPYRSPDPDEIYRAAQVLADSLANLGIMSMAEANEVLALRIMNHVLRDTRFQRTPAEARAVLDGLVK